MQLLERIDSDVLTGALRNVGADGWLLFDFHGVNPVAQQVVGYRGMVTRRLFTWLPAAGPPLAIVHRVDAQAVRDFPGEIWRYTTWQELHQFLEQAFAGKRVAMEVSPENAVPYLDRVPSGVVELLNRLGATVLPSDRLVTRFAARRSAAELEDHRATAEELAKIARATLAQVVGDVGRITEFQIQRRVLDAFDAAGLETIDPPIVAFGANAASPHHEPQERDNRVLVEDEVVLLDLWARSGGLTWADQTWMAFSGTEPPPEVAAAWEAIRDARDAVVERLRTASRAGEPATGAMLDDTARGLLRGRGYADAFVHRTGHSIDTDLHGSGPHLDSFETNDTRELVPGIVFSVEPGVYIEGRFGVRSEINVILAEGGPEVTPHAPQTELILAD